MTSLPQRYDRIAPWYDLLDAGFERKRYAALRPLMFEGLSGQLLDAGVGTGRDCALLPGGRRGLGHRHQRSDAGAGGGALPDAGGGRSAARDGRDRHALRRGIVRRRRVVLPVLRPARRPADQGAARTGAGGEAGRHDPPPGIHHAQGFWRRLSVRLWSPWVRWAYGARFDRQTERHAATAGLAVIESRFVYADLIKMLTLRVA